MYFIYYIADADADCGVNDDDDDDKSDNDSDGDDDDDALAANSFLRAEYPRCSPPFLSCCLSLYRSGMSMHSGRE